MWTLLIRVEYKLYCSHPIVLLEVLKTYRWSCTVFIIIIIIVVVVVVIIIISFMQGIYTYIPETNYVPREYSVAAILLIVFMVLISLVSVLNLLYFYISTFRSMCAVPIMAVFWVPWLHVLLVRYSCIFWMTLKQSQSPLLLLVSAFIIIIIIIIRNPCCRLTFWRRNYFF